MSKSGEAFGKLTYDQIRSMTLKEVGEYLDKIKNHIAFADYFVLTVEALKCGVMPK